MFIMAKVMCIEGFKIKNPKDYAISIIYDL
jgi:hypothetical protein